jgi:hypothetical protein
MIAPGTPRIPNGKIKIKYDQHREIQWLIFFFHKMKKGLSSIFSFSGALLLGCKTE